MSRKAPGPPQGMHNMVPDHFRAQENTQASNKCFNPRPSDVRRDIHPWSETTAGHANSRRSHHVVHEGIPTPLEDEIDDDSIGSGNHSHVDSEEDWYVRAEQLEEDEDPDADMNPDEYPAMLSHPPIASENFFEEEEEDELWTSPVAPDRKDTSHEGVFGNDLQEIQGLPLGAVESVQDLASTQSNPQDVFNSTMASPCLMKFFGENTSLILNTDAEYDPEVSLSSSSTVPRYNIPCHDLISATQVDTLSLHHFNRLRCKQTLALRPSIPNPFAAGYPAVSQRHGLTKRPSLQPSISLLNTQSRRLMDFQAPVPLPAREKVDSSTVLRPPSTHPVNLNPLQVPSIHVTAPLPAASMNNDIAAARTGPPKEMELIRPSSAHSHHADVQPALSSTLRSTTPIDASAIQQTSVELGPLLKVSNANSHELNLASAAASDLQLDLPMQLLQTPEETNTMDFMHEEDSTEPRHGWLSQETVSHIKDASDKIWRIINKMVHMDSMLTPSHIINYVFPNTVVHRTTYWNIFCAKYKVNHPNEVWDLGEVAKHFTKFKVSLPNDEWKEILQVYAKVVDLDAGQMTRGKHQSTFKHTFQELTRQLDYHSHRSGFEAILALVGANANINGPSIVGFHETSFECDVSSAAKVRGCGWSFCMRPYGPVLPLAIHSRKQPMCGETHDSASADQFADQKLHLKNNWAGTHLRAYVQNKKSDIVVGLHWQEGLDPEGDENVMPALQHSGDSSSLPYIKSTANTSKRDGINRKTEFVTFKILQPNDPKSTQMSCTVNLCAMMDYRQCPWKHLGKSLQEHNMLLIGWPSSLPLPINDENNPTLLSKGASSLSDSQKIQLAKVLEDTYYEAVYSAMTELLVSQATQVTAKPIEMDSNQPQTRQNSKNSSRNGNQSDQKAGEKRVRPTVTMTFEDPTSSYEDDISAGTKKKRKKTRGNRSQTQKVKGSGNGGNTMDHAMPTRTSHTVQASVNSATLPGKSLQEPGQITMEHQKQPKPHPMYKQAKTSLPGPSAFESRADVVGQCPHSTLQVGLQSNAGATTSLNMVRQCAHTMDHNSHEFQDFPGRQDLQGYGYVDILDDDGPGGSGLYNGMAA
ncbi:hypothetical protein F5146DRAFT_1003297 [Armillaria mellea]|nr:hypothetical protein F5146DRAFT_1003297 [Armillaria mellea]